MSKLVHNLCRELAKDSRNNCRFLGVQWWNEDSSDLTPAFCHRCDCLCSDLDDDVPRLTKRCFGRTGIGRNVAWSRNHSLKWDIRDKGLVLIPGLFIKAQLHLPRSNLEGASCLIETCRRLTLSEIWWPISITAIFLMKISVDFWCWILCMNLVPRQR